jgi:hypothetical protein
MIYPKAYFRRIFRVISKAETEFPGRIALVRGTREHLMVIRDYLPLSIG